MSQDPRAESLRAGYAPVARAYREQLGHELDGKPLDRALLDVCAERAGAGRLVDLGCGPGHITQYLATRGAGVEGVDIAPAMIAEAQASYPGLTFVVGDMHALPFADGVITGIVAMYSIVHLRGDELAGPAREMRRVLAPGGFALVAFHIGTEVVHVDELFGVATSLDFVFHDPSTVIAVLGAAGLALEARLDREPHAGTEHASRRCYLLVRAT